MIDIRALTHGYTTFTKAPGLRASLRDFFARRTETTTALTNVDLYVKEGESVALLGPNGAGKTTLLKILIGLIKPSSGDIEVMGSIPWKKDRNFLRSVGLLLGQRSQLAWDLPPSETLSLLAVIYGLRVEEAKRYRKSLYELLNVSHLADTPVRKLSLGQRMRFELIASLQHRPRLLLLDEPTIGLDLSSQGAIRSFLRSINSETNTTIVLTSHYARDVEEISDRLVVLNGGTIQHDGSIAALLEPIKGRTLVAVRTSRGEMLERYGFVESAFGEWRAMLPQGDVEAAISEVLAQTTVTQVRTSSPGLEDLLLSMYSIDVRDPAGVVEDA